MATADLCAPLATRKTVYVFPYPYSSHNAGSNEPIDFERMRFFLDKTEYLLINYEYKGYGAGAYPSFTIKELDEIVDDLLRSSDWRVLRRTERLLLLEKR